jgi:hypothetical protein
MDELEKILHDNGTCDEYGFVDDQLVIELRIWNSAELQIAKENLANNLEKYYRLNHRTGICDGHQEFHMGFERAVQESKRLAGDK